MESKEERLLRAIFGNEPQAKAIKFSMNLDDLTVNVSIRRNKKNKILLNRKRGSRFFKNY